MRILRSIVLWIAVAAGVLSETVEWDRRVDCFPEPGYTEANCTARNCLWDAANYSNAPHAPHCYFPQSTGFVVISHNENETILIKERWPPVPDNPLNPYGPDYELIKFTSKNLGSILNVRIEPRSLPFPRYEPKIGLNKDVYFDSDEFFMLEQHDPMNENEDDNSTKVFYFVVRRNSTNTAVWDTSVGGLMVADKYIQIATLLPTDKIYGFGENIHHTIKHDFSDYLTWSMLARDEGPNSAGLDTKNLYGVHPFYIGLEEDGKAHGVLILNSNPQEVTMGPAPHLVYRTIGGILDIYFLPGPLPEDVVKQYEMLIGKPFLPAYWALGYQLSRYGYKNLNEMKAVVEKVRNSGIPLDIPYADIDYMHRYEDFTLGDDWQDFPRYAQQLISDGLHLFLIFDPAIDVTSPAFERGIQANASFIEWPRKDMSDLQALYNTTQGTNIMLGVVWPDHHTAFPDFYDPQPQTREWWINEFKQYYEQVEFGGIWIDMNEPASFGTNEDNPWYFGNEDHPNITSLNCILDDAMDKIYDVPPYQTWSAYRYGDGSYLSTKTLCMMGRTTRGKEVLYNTKNLYGFFESIATQAALKEVTGKRGAVISRSTFPGSGRYAGHWLGDNTARWDDLRTSIIGVQEFNMFGIPYVGSDICGFNGDTNEELCLRWQQLGAFHPFSRNHNGIGQIPQDPAEWKSVADASRIANLFRYQYLPYLYYLHFDASRNGGTVVRPVFFEFPFDNETHNLGYQFMWGSGMMIVPVYNEGATSVEAYLPTTFFSLREDDYGVSYEGRKTFSASTTQLIPVFLREGVIVPRQAPEMTAMACRKNPLELVIAPEFLTKAEASAYGKFIFDDGESIVDEFRTHPHFAWEVVFSLTSEEAVISITRLSECSLIVPTLDVIDIFGYPYTPDFLSATCNDAKINISASTFDKSKKLVQIKIPGLISLDGSINILELRWNNGGGETSTMTTTTGTTTSTSTTATTTTTTTITAAAIASRPATATSMWLFHCFIAIMLFVRLHNI